MLRDEMLYFWPQIETKIMNEGWASYWHQRIMRELDLTSEETIEYAKLNSSVVQPSRHSLNPYYLGLKIFEDIENAGIILRRRNRQRIWAEAGPRTGENFRSPRDRFRHFLSSQLFDERSS